MIFILELEKLIPVFTKNQEEYSKRQTILARKMQTLERSRMLLTKQRTRMQEKADIESTQLQGRVTRGRLKDLTKDDQDNNSNMSGSNAKDGTKVLLEIERQKHQDKIGISSYSYSYAIDHEKSAREQRRQKRVIRNEVPSTYNKESFKDIDWSPREIMREFNRIKALRKRDKKDRRKRGGAKYSQRRKGSINTEEEIDLFEKSSDFEWPRDLEEEQKKETTSGRQVQKPDKSEEDENENENLKIIMQAN
jgi:hypothetical protein